MFRRFDHEQAMEPNWTVSPSPRRATRLPISKSRRTRGSLLLTVVLFGTVLYELFVSLNSVAIHEPLSHTITYRVGGTKSSATVGVADFEGGTSKHTSVPIPWELHAQSPDRKHAVCLSTGGGTRQHSGRNLG